MPAELPEDIFGIVLINQEIAEHDILRRTMVFKAVEKLLLVAERDL